MVRDLMAFADGTEADYALEFEEPALVTLGFAYEKRPRLSGGAYHPILRKTDTWLSGRLRTAATQREARADALLALDDAVVAVVTGLKQRGFSSPYLKTFVVARINPLRFITGDLPSVPDLLATMTKRARGMKLDKIRPEDVARSGGVPDEGE
jgi:ParB family chromosome partitioning protein